MSRLTKNMAYNLAGQTLLIFFALVAVKVLYRRLGGDAVGIIFAAATLATVLSATLELGIASTTVRQVSAHASGEPAYIQSFIRTASLLYWLITLFLAAAIFVGAPILVEKWIRLETMDAATAIHALRVLGIASLAALPRSLYTSVLRGLQRMEFNNLIDVTVSGLQQLGIVGILALGGGLSSIVYWFAACFAAGILAYLLIVARFMTWRALVPGFSAVVIRRNVRFSSHMLFVSILSTIHLQSDRVFVSKLLPLGTFGYYSLASRVVGAGTLPTVAIAQAALPSLSALAMRQDRERLMSQYRKLHDLLCFGTAPVFAAVAFAALPLFGYLFSPRVAETLFLPVVLLCTGYYMNGTLHVPYVFSLAVGKPEISARSNFLALFTVLPIAAILVATLGIAGAGLSWVVYHVWAYGYQMRRICGECLHITLWDWLTHVLRVGALGAITYGTALLLVVSVGGDRVGSLLAGYALATTAFSFGAYQLIGPELRDAVTRLPRAWRARSAHMARENPG